MKIISLGSPADIFGGPEPDPDGPPEYSLTLPVPAPDAEGAYVLLTVTPDGRGAAVLVDTYTVDERVVTGYLAGEEVVNFPKEAPWMRLKRDLLRTSDMTETRRKFREQMGKATDEADPACPIHGVPEHLPQAKADVTLPTGQYL